MRYSEDMAKRTTPQALPSRRGVLRGLAAVGLTGVAGVAEASPIVEAAMLPAVVEAYRGKAVVVHFWATWCGPCHRVFPVVNALAVKYATGLRVLGISLDADASRLVAWNSTHPPDWIDHRMPPNPVALAKAMKQLGQPYSSGVPFTAFFDKQGHALGHLRGAHPASSYERLVPASARIKTSGQWVMGPEGSLTRVN